MFDLISLQLDFWCPHCFLSAIVTVGQKPHRSSHHIDRHYKVAKYLHPVMNV